LPERQVREAFLARPFLEVFARVPAHPATARRARAGQPFRVGPPLRAPHPPAPLLSPLPVPPSEGSRACPHRRTISRDGPAPPPGAAPHPHILEDPSPRHSRSAECPQAPHFLPNSPTSTTPSWARSVASRIASTVSF